MKISTRLTLAFALMTLITAILAAFSVWQLRELKLDNEEIATVRSYAAQYPGVALDLGDQPPLGPRASFAQEF